MITMSNKRRGAALVVSAAAFAVALAGCNNGGGADVSSRSGGPALSASEPVATVNGDPITQSDFYTQLQRYTPNAQAPPAPAGRAVLQQLVMSLLLEQLAAKEGVAPTDADVNDQFNNIKLLQDKVLVRSFDDTLASAGLTEDDLKKFQLKPQLAQIKLLTKGVTVTDAEIKAFYDLHKKDQFTKPNRAHIKRIALTSAADANSYYSDIQKGKPFEDYVAKSIAKQPADGDLPQWVNLDDVTNPGVKPLVEAIKGSKAGDVPKPFEFQGAWWLVKVVDKKAMEVLPIDQVKIFIRYQLLTQKVQQDPATVQSVEQKLHEFQSTANIEIPEKQYNDLVTELKNPAPSMSAPGGPPPGAGGPPPAMQRMPQGVKMSAPPVPGSPKAAH